MPASPARCIAASQAIDCSSVGGENGALSLRKLAGSWREPVPHRQPIGFARQRSGGTSARGCASMTVIMIPSLACGMRHQQRVERHGALALRHQQQRVDVDFGNGSRMRGGKARQRGDRPRRRRGVGARPAPRTVQHRERLERSQHRHRLASLTGAVCTATSSMISAKMPPSPTITTGPNTGSVVVPRMSSAMPFAIGATSTPSIAACGALTATLRSISAKACRTSSSEARPT